MVLSARPQQYDNATVSCTVSDYIVVFHRFWFLYSLEDFIAFVVWHGKRFTSWQDHRRARQCVC